MISLCSKLATRNWTCPKVNVYQYNLHTI
uniref:Uncharacterized protein n=1 Tax=Arundo donax TaxID=35708 RepID=A0A0A9BD07_ARUDO